MKTADRARQLQTAMKERGYRASLADIKTYLADRAAALAWIAANPDNSGTLAEALAHGMPYYEHAHETRLYRENGAAYCLLLELAAD